MHHCWFHLRTRCEMLRLARLNCSPGECAQKRSGAVAVTTASAHGVRLGSAVPHLKCSSDGKVGEIDVPPTARRLLSGQLGDIGMGEVRSKQHFLGCLMLRRSRHAYIDCRLATNAQDLRSNATHSHTREDWTAERTITFLPTHPGTVSTRVPPKRNHDDDLIPFWSGCSQAPPVWPIFDTCT